MSNGPNGIVEASRRTVFTDALLPDGSLVDISCEGNVIAAIDPAPADSRRGVATIDLEGRLVLPALVEPHAHLDKAFLAERAPNDTGDLMGAIRALEQIRSTLTRADIRDRAVRAAVTLSRNGVVAVRTHADTTIAGGLTSVLGLLDAKNECDGFIDIEVAALMEWPLTGREGADRRALARDAISAGVDVIGGCPHLDPDPVSAVDVLVDLALEAGRPLDLHADENLRPDSEDLFHLARRIVADGLSLRANASHCVSLSMMDETRQREIADLCAAARVSVTALPQTNLFLQGREHRRAIPRGIAPIAVLTDAGVTVAAGGDNLQDPFNPMGRADPLEIAALLVVASHLAPDEALATISTGAAQVLGLSFALEPGRRASFVAVRATSVRHAIAMGPPDRVVVHGGVVIDEQERNTK